MVASRPATDRAAPVGLSREIGFVSLTASGVGLIIGAGVYVLIGPATADAGAPVWLAFLLASILSALTGLGYCELAAMFPRAAAEFEYSRHAFPPWIAFLTGWIMVFGLAVGAGAVSLGFAEHLAHFVGVPLRLGALGLIGVTGLIAASGIRNSTKVTVLLSLIQVGGLVLVIVAGARFVGDVSLVRGGTATGVLGAAALVFFAFIGFDEVTTLAEETRNPGKLVPRALIAALVISAVLYVSVAIVTVSTLGAERVATSNTPLADVVGKATGHGADNLVAGIALLSTFNTALLVLTAASRVMYGMAAMRAFPPSLGQVSKERRAPVRAILLCMAVAAAFALSGAIARIASVTDLAVYLVFLSVNATVVVLRFRMPDAERPFRMPLAVKRIPVVAVLAFVATLLMMSRLDRDVLMLGAIVISAGLVVGWVVARRTRWHLAEPGAS